MRREWCKKGAIKLNRELSNKYRRLCGINQSREAKSIGALNSAKNKKLTSTESKVKCLLEKLGYVCKLNRHEGFEMHAIIETKLRAFEVDFVKFGDSKPEIAIEVKSQKSETKGEALAYKIIKLRETYPNLKTICVVPKNMVNAGIKALKSEADFLVFNEELNGIKSVIRK